MTKQLAKPTVHLNGTSRESLQEQLSQAGGAIQLALKALNEAAPHARDYYPQGDGEVYTESFRTAVAQHEDRYARLQSVLDELTELYGAVSDVPGR